MLKKYTKYAATALAVASLSTFMIGCGDKEEEGSSTMGDQTPEVPAGEGENETPNEGGAPGEPGAPGAIPKN